MKTKYYHSTHGVITSHVDRDLLTAYNWSFSGREVDWLLFNDCDADFAEAFPLHIHKALLSEKDEFGNFLKNLAFDRSIRKISILSQNKVGRHTSQRVFEVK